LWLLGCLILFSSSAARADQSACLAAHEQAQIERLHGRYLEARSQLLLCVQDGCPGVVRSDCKGWLSEVERSLGSVVFAISDSSGRDLVDVRISAGETLLSEHADGRALELNPGIYSLRFEADGHAAQTQQLTVREGERQRIVRIALQPEASSAGAAPNNADPNQARTSPATGPSQRPRRLVITGYALGGLALASLATGVVFGTLGKQKLDDFEACKPDCLPSEVNAGRRQYYTANALFAASGALAVAAAVTLTLGLRATKRDRRSSAQVGVDGHGVSLGVRTAF
jgi:hypothetical protein